MSLVTVAVLARDNEGEIAECLESLSWADERIVILDTRSSDRTEDIARELGAHVVAHEFESFAAQREFGLTLPRNEWLFYVDSDERGTPELAEEIRGVVIEDAHAGWWVPRRNMIWGKEISHGGWYPDYQLRLLKAGRAHYDLGRKVHEVVVLGGSEGHLENPLIHHNYRTLGDFTRKQRQYVGYEAEILHQRGVRPKVWTYALQPLREFWRRYVRLEGYRDGLVGLAVCALVAYYYGLLVTVILGRRWRRTQSEARVDPRLAK